MDETCRCPAVVDYVPVVLRLNHKMYGSRKALTSGWFVSSRESMVLGPQTQSGQLASLIQGVRTTCSQLGGRPGLVGRRKRSFFDALWLGIKNQRC